MILFMHRHRDASGRGEGGHACNEHGRVEADRVGERQQHLLAYEADDCKGDGEEARRGSLNGRVCKRVPRQDSLHHQ